MNIAILGYGIEGKSAEKYFTTQGDTVEIFDNFAESDIDSFDLNRFDLILRSPSVRPRPDWSSATKIFFDKCPCPIIGVTGTKGKGTTASLIASILKSAGKTPHLLGNIGTSPLDALPKLTKTDIVVLELSSFQLWDLDKSPQVAVLTHLDIDHLDIHKDKEEYWTAKTNITKFQTEKDTLIYESDNPIAATIAKNSPAQKLTYPTHQFDALLDRLTLPGEHNRRNAEAAIFAARAVTTVPDETIKAGLAAFAGLPHRLQFVRELNGVNYYNDSISTTPGSAIAAINAFKEPKILILGGSSKGADFAALAQVIKTGNVKQCVLVGPEATKISQALAAVGYTTTTHLPEIPYSMPTVVKITTEAAQKGDTIILSPAAASFDSFKNYADRGDQFISAVKAL